MRSEGHRLTLEAHRHLRCRPLATEVKLIECLAWETYNIRCSLLLQWIVIVGVTYAIVRILSIGYSAVKFIPQEVVFIHHVVCALTLALGWTCEGSRVCFSTRIFYCSVLTQPVFVTNLAVVVIAVEVSQLTLLVSAYCQHGERQNDRLPTSVQTCEGVRCSLIPHA